MDDRNSEGFSTITPEEARAMMDDGDVVILDVREPSEFATGHVPGAINVPLGEIRMGRTLPECPDLDKTVLIYCRSGRRSDIGGRIMAASGYRDVRNFLGVLCGFLQRCAVLQLLHGQPNQQALTHGGAQRVDRQNLPLGIALAQLLRGDLGGAVGAAQTG